MDLNKSGIYKIVNKLNGRAYYGSAKKFKQRKWSHFNTLRRNNHDNPYLQNDYNKCGEENFEFKIILYCDEENLLFYEQRFLDKYWDNKINCYNILPTAGSSLGYKHSEEHKQKIGLAKKGKKNPRYNPTIYHFINDNGSEEKCTQWQLKQKYGLHHGHLSAVVKGKYKSIKGWALKK